jgi:hypothetical protein
MTPEELKEAKYKLEADVMEFLQGRFREFEDKTGFTPTQVELEMVESTEITATKADFRKKVLCNVSIKIEM